MSRGRDTTGGKSIGDLRTACDKVGQADSLTYLTRVLFNDGQGRCIQGDRPGTGEQPKITSVSVSSSSRRNTSIQGKNGEAIHQFEAAPSITSRFDWHRQLCWTHVALAQLFAAENRFDEANTHIGQAKFGKAGLRMQNQRRWARWRYLRSLGHGEYETPRKPPPVVEKVTERSSGELLDKITAPSTLTFLSQLSHTIRQLCKFF